jgi:polyisoprenyl-teichoic acid--peptidoglycan teichoic acid transferase
MKNSKRSRRKTLLTLSLIAFLLNACIFSFGQSGSPTPIPISDLLINQDQRYPATPTPFQPILSTPDAIPDSASTEATEPTKVIPVEPTSTPTPKLVKPEGQVNILLLGSDWRSGNGFRTDVILLLSLNTKTGSATLVSFPRDLYVEIPGIGMERINAAQEYGGFALTRATFMANFGIDVDYYMITNFAGFTNIVDTLGGITVFASRELNDVCALPQAVDGYCYIPYGNNFMNGETALWYVRSRHSTNDFDRTRRAQEVMIAIFQKSMGLDALSRGSELYGLFQNSVDTDLTVGTVLQLLPLAGRIYSDPSLIRRFAISSSEVYNYVVPATGAMVLVPDDTLVNQVLKQALEQ